MPKAQAGINFSFGEWFHIEILSAPKGVVDFAPSNISLQQFNLQFRSLIQFLISNASKVPCLNLNELASSFHLQTWYCIYSLTRYMHFNNMLQ